MDAVIKRLMCMREDGWKWGDKLPKISSHILPAVEPRMCSIVVV